MAKLEAEKVNEVLQDIQERVNRIGKDNLEGLLIVTNTEDEIGCNLNGSAASLEEMLAAVVEGLSDFAYYSDFSKEMAIEMICHSIKMRALSSCQIVSSMSESSKNLK